MGNVMGAILSGFGDIVGKLLGHPLDFLSGKACRYVYFWAKIDSPVASCFDIITLTFQFSMCPNMGFSLLHREFLHSSTHEIRHGLNPVILWSVTTNI